MLTLTYESNKVIPNYNVMGPAKASLESELGWDAQMLGLAGASYLTAYALGQFLSGWFGNRWGPRVIVLSGMGVSAGANMVFGLTNSWGTFLAFMVINGLAQHFEVPRVDAQHDIGMMGAQ